MATFTAIPDTDLDANSPITENLMLALRDNVLAIQEGDATAPKIQTDAYADLSVTAAKIANATITQAKINYSVGATGSISAASGSYTTLPNYGLVYYSCSGYTDPLGTDVQAYINGAWRGMPYSGFIYSSGGNFRIYSNGTAIILNYTRVA